MTLGIHSIKSSSYGKLLVTHRFSKFMSSPASHASNVSTKNYQLRSDILGPTNVTLSTENITGGYKVHTFRLEQTENGEPVTMTLILSLRNNVPGYLTGYVKLTHQNEYGAIFSAVPIDPSNADVMNFAQRVQEAFAEGGADNVNRYLNLEEQTNRKLDLHVELPSTDYDLSSASFLPESRLFEERQVQSFIETAAEEILETSKSCYLNAMANLYFSFEEDQYFETMEKIFDDNHQSTMVGFLERVADNSIRVNLLSGKEDKHRMIIELVEGDAEQPDIYITSITVTNNANYFLYRREITTDLSDRPVSYEQVVDNHKIRLLIDDFHAVNLNASAQGKIQREAFKRILSEFIS